MSTRTHAALFGSGLLLSAAACAPAATPGAQPHDMSVAGHEAMAANEVKTSQLHSAEYDSSATARREHCTNSATARWGNGGGGCWTSVTNPTAEHLDETKKHQRMAADHRAASQVLRDAEARACVGVSELDRDVSPFAHREDVLRVASLRSGGPSSRVEGVVVTFRALPGLTTEWLQKVVDCHIARNAALGHDVAEMAYCPLVPKGATAQVSQVADGFAVTIRTTDPDSIPELVRRAEALTRR